MVFVCCSVELLPYLLEIANPVLETEYWNIGVDQGPTHSLSDAALSTSLSLSTVLPQV